MEAPTRLNSSPPMAAIVPPTTTPPACVSFLFLYFFLKKNYRNIFLVLGFTVLYPYRPAGGRQGAYRPAGGGRDLNVNKKNFAQRSIEGVCRPPAGRQAPCRPTSWRQAPTTNIKLRHFPLRPHFLPTRSREGRGRVSEVIPPAKFCRILDPNRR